jgi:hypothetical protein
MSVVVPGPAYTFGSVATTATAAYRALGPLSPGLYLRRLEVMVGVTGATVIGISPVLAGVAEASAAAHYAGQALITNASGWLNDKPMWSVGLGAAECESFVLPLGVRIDVGGQYVVIGMSSSGVAVGCIWNVGIETLRRVPDAAAEASV